jgi:hypothetical protein
VKNRTGRQPELGHSRRPRGFGFGVKSVRPAFEPASFAKLPCATVLIEQAKQGSRPSIQHPNEPHPEKFLRRLSWRKNRFAVVAGAKPRGPLSPLANSAG